MVSLPWEDPHFYAEWSAQTYYYVCYSTRLLAASSARCPLDMQEFHHRFNEHSDEEKSHEKLCLLDLKALNRPIKDFSESATAAAMYQTQYYWIEHRHPLSLFGYILALESISIKICPELTQRVTSKFGPKAAHF